MDTLHLNTQLISPNNYLWCIVYIYIYTYNSLPKFLESWLSLFRLTPPGVLETMRVPSVLHAVPNAGTLWPSVLEWYLLSLGGSWWSWVLFNMLWTLIILIDLTVLTTCIMMMWMLATYIMIRPQILRDLLQKYDYWTITLIMIN